MVSIAGAEELAPRTYSSLTPRTDLQLIQPSREESLIDHLARTYRTPQTIAKFLHDEFTFKQDKDLFGEVDYWQTPQEFAVRKSGDCEDYALLAETLLRRNGIEAYVFSVFGDDGYAHTISIFRDEKGRYNAINQGAVRYYRAKSLEALASQLYPSWNFAGIVEPDGKRGRMVREIRNAHPISSLNDLDGSPALSF